MKDKQANKADERLPLDALQDVSGGKTLPWDAPVVGGAQRSCICAKCGKRYSYVGGTAHDYHKCPKCGTIN